MEKTIKIKGARTNNLKNIDVEIPRHQLVVITGLSGSGKSSLAFDTIYAEGQRRYMESLSSYAKQYVDLMDKPDVDSITGLTPSIAIDQKTSVNNPRSTVGTATEIYDLLRLLFARVGIPHCPETGKEMTKDTPQDIIKKIAAIQKPITVLSPILKNKIIEDKKFFTKISRAGFSHARYDGQIINIREEEIAVNYKKHDVEIVIAHDKFNKENLLELQQAAKKGLDLSNGYLNIIINGDKQEKFFSTVWTCEDSGLSLDELEPKHFSFNSPHGACPACHGLGATLKINPENLLNKKLTINEGAIRPWPKNNSQYKKYLTKLAETAKKYKFDLDTPAKKLTSKQLEIVYYGDNGFEGVLPILENRYNETDSAAIKSDIFQYMDVMQCKECGGKRLKPEFLAVAISGINIADIATLNVDLAIEKIKGLTVKLNQGAGKIAEPIIKEILSRLRALQDTGLNYIAIDRSMDTLSGGEAQRVKLATQLSSNLVNITYVLDEPSVGLHQKDLNKLIATLKKLRDLENTVIVVEHDETTMLAADYIIDIGPGAGSFGGLVTAAGAPAEIKKNIKSLTGQYLSGNKSIPKITGCRPGNKKSLKIIGAKQNNLKNITVEFPLGKFIALTGVSGSGKSTLMTDILSKALNKKFYRAKEEPGEHKKIEGLENIDKVISIDQSPIGRTPRSNPATYTGAFTYIRELFSELPEAKIKNLTPAHFSFNVVGGRCEACGGDGYTKIDMQFLSDVYVKCKSCSGRRYQKEILEVYYRDKNIADILDMAVVEAKEFFRVPTAASGRLGGHDTILQKLNILDEVGLGYVKLGQSATTLSGGEAQRVKLATELSRRETGKTLYILDEPTTGLHFEDIKKLLNILNKLVDKGNTVLIIEHNLDVIKSCDHIIDLGPEGGDKGGEVVAEGAPAAVAKNKKSFTGEYLKKVL